MKNENLKRRLNKWCEESCTTCSTVFYQDLNDNIIIKRYDGFGIPEVINTFKNENEVAIFLNEMEDLQSTLYEYSKEVWGE